MPGTPTPNIEGKKMHKNICRNMARIPPKERGIRRGKLEKCHKYKYFREVLPNLTLGRLFMLGRVGGLKIIYVRPVSGPENTSKIGKILKKEMIGVTLTNSSCEFLSSNYLWHISGTGGRLTVVGHVFGILCLPCKCGGWGSKKIPQTTTHT